MIVVISDPPEGDLETIGDWIAKENPTRALTFVRELRQACKTLNELPLGHALVARYEHTGVRRRVYGNYLISIELSAI
jgi:plasmid stabilization system protein ParE